mmetsp:Transcript_26910/g.55093  ORF Transcript_26910/g.55093 Transcript_26910/m.55093 type:complete len:255 (-) Transcript_26910:97-861(-)
MEIPVHPTWKMKSSTSQAVTAGTSLSNAATMDNAIRCRAPLVQLGTRTTVHAATYRMTSCIAAKTESVNFCPSAQTLPRLHHPLSLPPSLCPMDLVTGRSTATRAATTAMKGPAAFQGMIPRRHTTPRVMFGLPRLTPLLTTGAATAMSVTATPAVASGPRLGTSAYQLQTPKRWGTSAGTCLRALGGWGHFREACNNPILQFVLGHFLPHALGPALIVTPTFCLDLAEPCTHLSISTWRFCPVSPAKAEAASE